MHVLVTGATGFIGGSLAASLLERGVRVTCLARDPRGTERTRRSIAGAAEGFGFDVDPERVDVLPYDTVALHERHGSALSDLDAVWHCAAFMSFSRRRLRESIDVNVGGTVALLRAVASLSRKTPRFHYMSTAYTGGVEAEAIGETLHLTPHLVNPYFVSKWGAELVLEKLTRDGGLPVTILRPTIVVGHSQTGWYGGQSFGLYNFLDGVWAGVLAGQRRLRLDIAPATRHNYLPVDDLVLNAAALTLRGPETHEPFEVLIAEGTDNTNEDRVRWIAEGLGVELELGAPRSVADHAVDLWVAVNKPFNQPDVGDRPFPFESGKIEEMLGDDFRHNTMDRDLHLRLVRWYRDHRLVPLRGDVLRSPAVRAVRLAGATGLQALLPARPTAGIVAKALARAHGLA